MISNRFVPTFERTRREGKTVLVAYVTVGFHGVETSFQCALSALEAGADILELGVPFSDPTADGPVISKASFEAIQSGGSLRAALSVLRRLRELRSEPILLFSYYNPIVAFGEMRLVREVAEAGGDGLLIVDLPPEEGQALRSAAVQAGVSMIPLIAPTSGAERETTITKGASGFIYYVSVTGVTGSSAAPLEKAGRHAAALEAKFSLPVVVGFGIGNVEQARAARGAGASGVVVGTAIIRAIAAAEPGDEALRVGELVHDLRAGLDAP